MRDFLKGFFEIFWRISSSSSTKKGNRCNRAGGEVQEGGPGENQGGGGATNRRSDGKERRTGHSKI